MKILVITSRIPFPLKDGGAIATYNQLFSFFKSGAEVTIFSLNTLKHYVTDDVVRKEFSNFSSVITHKIDTSVTLLSAFKNLFTSKSYNIQRFYDTTFEHLIESHLRQNTYDVIQIEGLYVSMYAKVCRNNSSALLSLRQHNVEYEIWEKLSEQVKNPIKKWYLKLLSQRLKEYETQVLNHFDCIIAITESDAKTLKLYCQKDVVVIVAGVTETSVTIQHTNSDVFHIGSMEWMPNKEGIDWFLGRVWPLVTDKIPNANFFLAGKGIKKEDFSTQPKEVHVVGEVESAPDFMGKHGIMVVPLFAASGIRIKTIEALMAGRAVVTTPVGLNGIPAEHNKHLLVAETAESFANAIIELIQDKSKRQLLAETGKEWATMHFGSDMVVKKLLDYYRQRISA